MSGPPVDEGLLEAAAHIATEAAGVTLQYFRRSSLAVERKQDGTEVTIADRKAEQVTRDLVAQYFPEDSVIGEESGAKNGTSGRSWIVDPIDGTTSFVRGVPLFSTLLAVVDEHGPAVGIIVLPALGETLISGRGRGAHRNSVRCRVSKVDELADSLISSSSFDASWWPGPALDAILSSGARTRTWGDGYGYFLVATGGIEAMVEPPVKLWDIAPMTVIIGEAGGICTTWDGGNELQPGPWVASNGLIHQQLLDLL